MTAVVQLVNGSYCREGETDLLLEHISAEFEAGKIYLIFGDSKAERRILASIMAGLERFTTGEIIYDDQQGAGKTASQFPAKKVGTVFQNYNYIPELSAVDNLYYHLQITKQPIKKRACMHYLNSFGMNKTSAGIPLKKAELFIQKKYCLAKSVISKPRFLILDGFLTGLDFRRQELLLSYLNQLAEEDMCIILMEDDQFSGKYTNEVWGLNRGRLSFIKSRD